MATTTGDPRRVAAADYIQDWSGGSYTSRTGTFGVAPVKGQVLIAFLDTPQAAGSITSVQSGAGSSPNWTLLDEATFASSAHSVGIWYKFVDGDEGTSVTATWTSSVSYVAFALYQYSGIAGGTLATSLNYYVGGSFDFKKENQASANSATHQTINANDDGGFDDSATGVVISACALNNGGGSPGFSDARSIITSGSSNGVQLGYTARMSVVEGTMDSNIIYGDHPLATSGWYWTTSRTWGAISVWLIGRNKSGPGMQY